ncbi:MAG: hypothetical protein ACOY46_07865 [Bacillota bacterium]
MPEPLAEWYEILQRVLTSDVSAKKRERIEKEYGLLADIIENVALVYAHDLSGTPLTLQGWLTQPQLLNEAAKHVIWHLILLIAPIMELIDVLSQQVAEIARGQKISNIPYMREFYDFLLTDRSYVLRKRRWP